MLTSTTVLLPEKLITLLYIPGWNLGDVHFTVGIQDLFEHEDEDMLPSCQNLEAHFRGYYGLDCETVVRKIQLARDEGKSFGSFWRYGGEIIKIVTNQTRRITTVCLARED